MIRALVVDDTILYRTIVSKALEGIPDLRVVGSAPNGKIALSRIYQLKPDLVTLDIEMPEMNGIEVLEAIAKKNLDTSVIVVSSLTERGGELTMRALEAGAIDFITKPAGKDGIDAFNRDLASVVAGVVRRLEITRILKDGGVTKTTKVTEPVQKVSATRPKVAFPAPSGYSDIIAIGISTGGPQALQKLIPELPANLGVPVVIVQHMPPLFTANLARSLANRSKLPVKEAENGEPLLPGTVYIAPGGKQTKIALAQDAVTKIIRVTDDPPERNCRPSVDYLFRSVAHLYYGKATAVIMTGMGDDGVNGLDAIKRSGGRVLAQDAASCVVWGMPKSAVEAGLVDAELPLELLASAILATVH